jgi:hypothetical protein
VAARDVGRALRVLDKRREWIAYETRSTHARVAFRVERSELVSL